MAKVLLRDIVKVRGHYHRSTQLARDWADQTDLSQYILTPTSHELASRIADALREPNGPKAWSITGPYGSGKSAFALFLTDLLARDRPLHPGALNLRADLALGNSKLLPILVQGQRAPLVVTLLSHLVKSLAQIEPGPLIADVQDALAHGAASATDVTEYFERAALLVQEQGYGGLLICVDEFGKLLEYAALHQDSEDLLVMQQLAEMAARSAAPVLLITILHTAFVEYARGADAVRQAEWQKVQGRFVDAAFLEPPEQVLGLIAAALYPELPTGLEAAYSQTVERSLASTAFTEVRRRLPLERLLPGCVPLEPTTALLLWPVFRSKLAQHERSLFGFLTSSEPFGFQDFLATTDWDGGAPPLYRLDRLFDYIATSLGAAVFRGDRSHRWAEIEHALSRIGAEAPVLAKPVAKAIGLLSLYGSSVGLCASLDTLRAALGNNQEVDEAVRYLQTTSILIYRKHENAYALWEGSDVDLDACYEQGRQHVGRQSLAARLKRLVTPTSLVAKAHYLETGTLRYFTSDIIDGTPDAIRNALAIRSDQPPRVIYVLNSKERQSADLIELSLDLTKGSEQEQKLQILAFVRPTAGLEEALEELEIWTWVLENTPALQGDSVARQEVKARVVFARNHLEEITGRVLGLRGHLFEATSLDWIQGGARYTPRNAQEFVRWLSALCDEVYCAAPKFQNELLNRESLSSSATAARRNLLAAMLENPGQHRLGITGTPPEYAMYETLLVAGGFHRERNGHYSFGEPYSEWQPVWTAINEFLQSAQSGRRKVPDLYSMLERAPFGLREGPLPVLLTAMLLSRKDEIALYEGGAFVPELRIEVLERLTRVPVSFEIQDCALSDDDKELFAAINAVIAEVSTAAIPSIESTLSPLLQTVRPLVLFAAHLPAYTKFTRRLQPDVMAVRDVLLHATDPYRLMLSDLPAALGINPEDPSVSTKLPTTLSGSLHALRRAYPDLLDSIEHQLRTAFDLQGTPDEARLQLMTRAERLLNYVVDKSLLTFVREAARLDSRDWREVLARAVSGGNPSAQWRDQEVTAFQVRLQQLRSDFVRIEELVAEERHAPGSQVLRIGLLNGHVQEAREVIAVTSENQPLVENLANQVGTLLDSSLLNQNGSEGSRRLRLAVLAQAAAKYLLTENEPTWGGDWDEDDKHK